MLPRLTRSVVWWSPRVYSRRQHYSTPFREPRQAHQQQQQQQQVEQRVQQGQQRVGQDGRGRWSDFKWPLLTALSTSGLIVLYHVAEKYSRRWEAYRRSRLIFRASSKMRRKENTKLMLSPVDDAALVDQRLSTKLRLLKEEMLKDISFDKTPLDKVTSKLDIFPSSTLDVHVTGNLMAFPAVYLLADEWLRDNVVEDVDKEERSFWLSANISEEAKKFVLARGLFLSSSIYQKTLVSSLLVWLAFFTSQSLRILFFSNMPKLILLLFNYIPICTLTLLLGLKVLDGLRDYLEQKADLRACQYYAQGGVDYYTSLMRRFVIMAKHVQGLTIKGDYRMGLLYNENRSLALRLRDCQRSLERSQNGASVSTD